MNQKGGEPDAKADPAAAHRAAQLERAPQYIYIYRNILCSEGSPPRAQAPPDGRQRNRKKKT